MCNLSDGVMELGRREGEAKGGAEGEKKGENKLAALMKMLFSQGCSQDAEKAATDPEYREKLYAELGIA